MPTEAQPRLTVVMRKLCETCEGEGSKDRHACPDCGGARRQEMEIGLNQFVSLVAKKLND